MARDRNATDPGRVSQPVGFSSLRASDLPKVMEIERACYDHPWSEDSFREIVSRRTLHSLGARSVSGELLGYIIFSEDGDELHILNVAVHPNHQRHGLAKTMLTHLHNHAADRGRSQAFLEVRESNQPAQALYAQFGYKPFTKRMEYYEEDRENALVMVAPLPKRKKGWRR